MKKKYVEDDSENEFDVDEPEELQGASDDDEWTPSNNRESGGRRQSSRLRQATKKARFVDPLSSEDDDDDLDEDSSDDDKRRKGKTKTSFGRGGRGSSSPVKTAAIKVRTPSTLMSPANIVTSEATSTTTEKEFASGAFVVLRNDYQKKDNPPIWKIDGKALLQKYIPFTKDGKTLYKNTSTYSGWSLSNKDQYYSAPVVFKSQDKKEIVVEFSKSGVKE